MIKKITISQSGLLDGFTRDEIYLMMMFQNNSPGTHVKHAGEGSPDHNLTLRASLYLTKTVRDE